MSTGDYLLILLALALGFALFRARLCTVACLRESILQQQHAGMLRLCMATSVAGVVLLSAALWMPAGIMLPVDSPAWTRAAAGGMVLGVGSMLNGACFHFAGPRIRLAIR
jgi:hypothetical protein